MKKLYDDEALISRILGGDDDAFILLYKRHQSYVRRIVSRAFNDTNLVDEVVQDVFMACIDGLSGYRKSASFKTYLFAITRHKIIDTIRRKTVKRALSVIVPNSLLDALSYTMSERRSTSDEIALRVTQILQSLPHDYAMLLRLKYMDNLSVCEIAQQLSVTPLAAQSKLYRARQAFVIAYERADVSH